MQKTISAFVLLFAPYAVSQNLDRFGGDRRLMLADKPAREPICGHLTAVDEHKLVDSHAAFPAGGSLSGYLVNPAFGRSESSANPEHWFRIVRNTATELETDSRDGDLRRFAAAGGSYCMEGVFTTARSSKRWWFVDPAGFAFFPKAVSKTDLSRVYSQQDDDFRPLPVVYVRNGNDWSRNLSAEAANETPNDVVGSWPYTLREVGDELLLGAEKPFNAAFVVMGTGGQTGALNWYFSTAQGTASWRLLNGTGQPAEGSAGLDSTRNRIRFWPEANVFPTDFSPLVLVSGERPMFYLKAVVVKRLDRGAVVSQLYDAMAPYELLHVKYAKANGSSALEAGKRWVQAINVRYRAWGWNMAGQYSRLYEQVGSSSPEKRMPLEVTVPLSGMAMEGPWNVKNVYRGVQCPPGSGQRMYEGKQPDAFQPEYRKAIEALAARHIRSNPWILAWIPEEADELFGLDKETHVHLGYMVLAQNPYLPVETSAARTDARFYAKYALRDLLRHRYREPAEMLAPVTVASPVPAYEYSKGTGAADRAALARLNAAWGTQYTSWGTETGNVADGTNAWGSGRGFLDENGRAFFQGDCAELTFEKFTAKTGPAVRQDLDAFVSLFTAKYGSIIYPAVKARTANLVMLPIYAPPDMVSAAIGPYTDALWTSFGGAGPSHAKRIYDLAGKPLLVADYLTASPDSPLSFSARIIEARYESTRDRTVIRFGEQPYRFARAFPLEFPDSRACATKLSRVLPAAVSESAVELSGNYVTCLRPGDRIRTVIGNQPPTQEERARRIEQLIQEFLGAQGKDGMHFVAGWEHWSYMDHPRRDQHENFNFGLATSSDNAYDGVEARRAVTRDAAGRLVGAEDRDYGNLAGKLAPFLNTLYDRLLPPSTKARLRVRVLDRETGHKMPATLKIQTAGGAVVKNSAGFGDGVRSPGVFETLIEPGSTLVQARRGFDYAVEETRIDLRSGDERELTLSLRRRSPLRREGWMSGDNHVHMVHGEAQVHSTFPEIQLAARAEGLDYLSVAQRWNLPDPSALALSEVCRKNSTPGFTMTWNLEAPKNYWRGDVSHCMGHGWTLAMGDRTADGRDPVQELDAMSAHDYQREKVPTPNFDSHALIHDLGGIVSYTHPARWWRGKWGGRNGYPAEADKFVSNLAQELPFDTIAGPTYDTIDILMKTRELEVNRFGQQLWYMLLNRGYRLAGTASSDATFDRPGGAVPGKVRTYTRIEGEFSIPKVAAAMRAGRNFVTSGPLLVFDINGHGIGESLRINGPAKLRVGVRAWAAPEPGSLLRRIELIRNGEAVRRIAVADKQIDTAFELEEKDTAWYVVRCLGENEDEVAISNPIYVERGAWQRPEPTPATVHLTVVDARNGEQVSASVAVIGRVGREERTVRRAPCHGSCTLIMPATARFRIEASGHTSATRSVFLDTPELLETTVNAHLEQLLDWATFERIRHALGRIQFRVELAKMSEGKVGR
ncbi:MAG TPA: CehA/McbA family metallohydrolase [Bryobacteraceae bacterium]|nr:CehA/McbA family metallohydrolase [Bryobacteraceae bacterium]